MERGDLCNRTLKAKIKTHTHQNQTAPVNVSGGPWPKSTLREGSLRLEPRGLSQVATGGVLVSHPLSIREALGPKPQRVHAEKEALASAVLHSQEVL